MRIVFLLVLYFFMLTCLSAGEQLNFYQADKNAAWELYVEGTVLSLSGEGLKAIEKWKLASEKGNLHAMTRLYQEDMQNGKQDFQRFYEKKLDSNFAILQYLKSRYQDTEDEAQKEKLIQSMLELENTDDYWALSIVGNYYTDKLENRTNFNKGIQFLRKAAEGGYSPAQTKIGYLYWQGNQFFNKNLKLAKEWLEKATATKDKYACLYLAQIYHKVAENEKNDVVKAIPLYKEAAKQGVYDAYLNLGLIYEEGQTVAKDSEKAHQYFLKLLDCEDVEIYQFLGNRYFNPYDGVQDKKQGLLWYEKAAEYGSIADKYKYADLYYLDPDMKDYRKALQLFLILAPADGKVSQKFHILIYLRLGAMYMNGYGVKQDYAEAKKYYDKVNTTSEALEAIIAMYLNGWGVQQSDDMVIFYISKLMDPTRAQGYNPGPYFTILAHIYKKRDNKEKYLENLRLAALCDDQQGLTELKELYQTPTAENLGDLGDIHFAILNYHEAEEYYKKEIAKNNLRNRYQLIRLMAVEKSNNYNPAKSLEEMQKLAGANFSTYTETLDHTMIDRVIDPELVGVILKARPYYWLGVQYKKRADAGLDGDRNSQLAVKAFLQAETAGCIFAGLNASVILLRSEKEEDWAKGRTILERLYQNKNPFAAALLGGVFSLSKFKVQNSEKAASYFDDAKKWDNHTNWANMSVESLIQRGIHKLFINVIKKQIPNNPDSEKETDPTPVK